MKKIWWLIALIIIIVSAYIGYATFSSTPDIQILKTAQVETTRIRSVLVETGIIKLQVGASIKIGARATGAIMKMKVKIGSNVKKGDLIAQIDDREILNEIQQTEAAILSKRYTLSQIHSTFPERIKEAKANYDYAKIDHFREKELIKDDFTTQNAVDQSKSRYDALEAQLKRVENEYKTETKIVQADLKKLVTLLEQQQIKLSYTKIIAPINGIVSDVTAQEGETVVTGLQVANLVTIINPLLLEMWIYVDETNIGTVKVGQLLEYYVDTYPDTFFNGTVDNIYPQPVVKDNITYYLAIVKISVKDAALLKPEMTTYVKIITSEKENSLTIANAAVKYDENGHIGYKIDGNKKVEKIALTIGIRGEETSEILSGAKEGDVLATELILPIVKGMKP